MKRSTWARHEEKDIDLDVAGGPTELAAYLGTSYYIDLRKPKTKDELKTLLHQLEALSDQFDVALTGPTGQSIRRAETSVFPSFFSQLKS